MVEASADLQGHVLDVVRGLAAELGGHRAEHAVSPEASLERDIGLGSLERVELMLRLEGAFGRRLGDEALAIDTPAELARALALAGAAAVTLPRIRAGSVREAAPVDGPFATVHEALWRRSLTDPDRPHAYVREDDGTEIEVRYGRLWAEAARVAGGLREHGVGKGHTVALMLPTGVDFLRVFQGILIAGAIPVPIYPPARLDRLEEYALRQSAILADAGVRILVTVPRAAGVANLLRPRVPTLSAVTTASELMAVGASWHAAEGSGSDAAFIQYTSGSTGHPKGVLLTHENLMANMRAIGAGLAAGPADVGASWLPLYHDMGLIGSWLFCLCRGLPIAILSPLAFLARPERWLWTIHERRATLSAAPNFAYELCVSKIPDSAIEGLDLSSWRCALNGAEPVNPETLDRFATRFAPYGFRREALMPVYGLAENSVALCFPPPGRGPRVDTVAREPFEGRGEAVAAATDEGRALRFVSVGRALPEHEAHVVGPAGEELPERFVGRLVFRGPSMTPGYYKKPEATAEMTLPGGWLDSGDLAYVAGGEIFIAGRTKDLIIKGGRNLVPQEIEEIAASVEGVRKGCVVAFGVANAAATESLVIVAETRQTDPAARERIASAITERVAAAIGVPPDSVVAAPPGAIPKTSSGKVRRGSTRALYLDGTLGRPPRTSVVGRARLVASGLLALASPRVTMAWRGLYAAYLGLVLAILALAIWPLAALLPSRRTARILERMAPRAALYAAGCRLELEGGEHLRGSGSFLLVSNHTSYVDIAALLAILPRDFIFVAKREILRWPLVGLFVRRAGHLTVDRGDAQDGVAAAANVARAVESGESVLVFPEATFTASPGLRPFRLGAFKTAAMTGTPVVPIAIQGARQVLRDGFKVPRPGPIRIWVGAPLSADGTGWRDIVDLRDRVANAIAAHCGEPRLDLVAAGPVKS